MKKYYYQKNKRCLNCGKIINDYATKCSSCAKITHGKYLENHYCIDCGKELKNVYATRCNSCANTGKNSHVYIHGNGCLPYTYEFIKIRKQIRKRDNYTCQLCGMTQEEHFEKYKRDIEVHHIDYCTLNCLKIKLITLCHKCNMKANSNRDYWFAYYKYIMEKIKC